VIEQLKAQGEPYSLVQCCSALGVSRSGLYAQKLNSAALRRSQDAIVGSKISFYFFESRKTYGCRRLQKMLQRDGIWCGKNRISRLMCQLGLQAIQKRRFRPQSTQSRHHQPIAPNRLIARSEPLTEPNEIWIADITYLPTLSQGWLYLAVEMDLCSRALVGWRLADCLAAPLVIEAFQRAVKAWSVPQMHHSDRGVQYAAEDFRQLLKTYGVCPSMSRTANPYDNAVMESFFATLKTECFQNNIPQDRAQAHMMLFDYIETFYNPMRLHSALDYRSPLEFQAAHRAMLLGSIAGEERANRNQTQKTATSEREAKSAQARNGINGGDPSASADGAQAVYAGFDLEPIWRSATGPATSKPLL
jgi:transposase InsO family protein